MLLNARLARSLLVVASSAALGGCDLVLGLGDYKEGPGSGGSGGATSGSMSTTGSTTTGSGTSSSSTGTFCEPNATADCYTGMPTTTEGVGDCRGGTATCDMNGSAYGMCVGEVVPAAVDNYPKKGDENCDGSPTSDTLGAHQYGDTSYQAAFATATDSMGNVLITGEFDGTIKFGAQTLIANGRDGYLAKLAADGTPMWAIKFGDTPSATGIDVAVDSMDNVILTGTNSAAISIGAFTVPSAGSFVAKFDPNGNAIWVKGCSGATTNGVAVDPMGDVVIAGNFSASVNCGTAMTGPSGAQSIVVAKWLANGTASWSKAYFTVGATASDDYARDVATDSSGNIWFVGSIKGTVDFGPPGGSKNGGNGSGFLAKLTPAGVHVTSSSYIGTFAVSAAVDSFGGPAVVYESLTGMSYGVGGAFISGTGLAKYNSAGTHQWSVGTGVNPGQTSLAFDSQDNGFLSARFAGSTLALPGAPVFTLKGATDGVLWHFDTLGHHIYAKQYGGATFDDVVIPRDLAVTPSDDVVLVGQFRGSFDSGASTLTSPSTQDDALLMTVAH